MFKSAKEKNLHENEKLLEYVSNNLFRIIDWCEVLSKNENLTEEEKKKIINMARMDANAALHSLESYIVKLYDEESE